MSSKVWWFKVQLFDFYFLSCEHMFVHQSCRKRSIEMPGFSLETDAHKSTNSLLRWWKRPYIYWVGMLSFQNGTLNLWSFIKCLSSHIMHKFYVHASLFVGLAKVRTTRNYMIKNVVGFLWWGKKINKKGLLCLTFSRLGDLLKPIW